MAKKKAIREGAGGVKRNTSRTAAKAIADSLRRSESSYTRSGVLLSAMLLHLEHMMDAHQQAAVHKPYARGKSDQSLTRFTTEDVQKFRRIALAKAFGE